MTAGMKREHLVDLIIGERSALSQEGESGIISWVLVLTQIG